LARIVRRPALSPPAAISRWSLLLPAPLLSAAANPSPRLCRVTRPGHSIKGAVGVAGRPFEARTEASIGPMPDLYLPDVSKLTATLSPP